jgi:uncharacterized membrane protein
MAALGGPPCMSQMNPNARLEAFCDGVFAIALTLLIIDIKAPSSSAITSTDALWRALQGLLPSIFAFLLSFAIIFITWMNHHSIFQSINKSSGAFIYSNAFLLLTVVFIPFPTALLGAYLLTDHAAPAVVIYNAAIALQAVGWVLFCGTALRDGLTKDDAAKTTLRTSHRHAWHSVFLYSALAVGAFWFPQPIAAVTTLSWIIWLVFGLYTLKAAVST